jgi:hypothetical protein
LNKPLKVVCTSGLNVIFIDAERNAVVTVQWSGLPVNLQSTTAAALNMVTFDTPSNLNSIGYGLNNDNTNDFYVTDIGTNYIHHFSGDGLYLASYSSFSTSNVKVPFNGSSWNRVGEIRWISAYT